MNVGDVAKLEQILTERLGDKTRAVSLAKAYLDGVQQFAFDRTTGTGAVPTTITDERVELLLAVSKGLGRLIDSREIECLLRVIPSVAKRVQLQLRSTHEDTIRPFIYAWALTKATAGGRGQHNGVTGRPVTFRSLDQLEAFETEAGRTGLATARDIDEAAQQWILQVGDAFDFKAYGL